MFENAMRRGAKRQLHGMSIQASLRISKSRILLQKTQGDAFVMSLTVQFIMDGALSHDKSSNCFKGRLSSHPSKHQQTAEESNMAPKLELSSAAACFIFLALIPPAEAYDAGDALALILGTIITMVGFFACLGWTAYAHTCPVFGLMWKCATQQCDCFEAQHVTGFHVMTNRAVAAIPAVKMSDYGFKTNK
ncbi:uncharacterized protein V6R79_011423 [Siganus canaliculatus]